MAHANPEFALGLQTAAQHQDGVEVTFRDLHSRIREIEALVRDGETLRPDELRIWQAWCSGRRRINAKRRQETAEFTSFAGPRAGGMHAGAKIGERFLMPERRSGRWTGR